MLEAFEQEQTIYTDLSIESIEFLYCVKQLVKAANKLSEEDFDSLRTITECMKELKMAKK